MSEHTIDNTHEPNTDVVYEGHGFNVIEHGVHHPHSTRKQIWQVFFVMLAITVLELFIALTPFTEAAIGRTGKIGIFFFLTVVKAFYIVGYFMHLKQEKMNMAYAILIPLLFILYLITLLMFEGSVSTHIPLP